MCTDGQYCLMYIENKLKLCYMDGRNPNLSRTNLHAYGCKHTETCRESEKQVLE